MESSHAAESADVLAVLFADIAGSTKLYDTLGDAQAKQLVDECLGLMRAIVTQYGGRVVKTIGDEVMCVLPTADSACLAATDMQLRVNALPAVGTVRRGIRVGFHFGPVLQEHQDVFGDTVNLAARMAGVAKAGQIMTTGVALAQLSPLLRSATRRIAALSVKGKGDDVEVCEILWQGSDELTMATPSIISAPKSASLLLEFGDQQCVLAQANTQVMLGRDPACQIAVADRMASRVHARIELRQGKFYLQDQSTNGTFVACSGEPEISLRREELMLRGQGRIAFGRSVADTLEHTVLFTVQA